MSPSKKDPPKPDNWSARGGVSGGVSTGMDPIPALAVLAIFSMIITITF